VKTTTAMAACVEEEELDGEGVETTPAWLLLRFPAAACSRVVERGGALRVQYLAGVAGVDEPEREGERDGVWAVAGSGVRLLV
jgi:hypothetical protein